jgi:membrane fusion protein
LGSIQLLRPLATRVLTVLVVLITFALGFYLFLGHYTHKARVSGYLVPDRGMLRLLSPQAGTLVERRVTEGQTVREGDVLFVLSLERSTQSGDTQEAIQNSLMMRERSLREAAQQKTQLQQAQIRALDQQLANRHKEQSQLASQLALQRERLQLAQQTHVRFKALHEQGFVSDAQVQIKTEEWLNLKAQLQVIQRQQVQQQRETEQLQAERLELPLQAGVHQGEIQRDLAALTQASVENEAKRQLLIRAPNAGVVTAILASVGQNISPQIPLASLVPSGARLQAHLLAPSSAMGFVKPHQPVLMRDQAYPYQKFGHQHGQVVQISRAPLQNTELADLPTAKSDEPLYRIVVDLDQQEVQAYGQTQQLSPGMQLDADIMLDRRRLIEWIFEPILSIANRV